ELREMRVQLAARLMEGGKRRAGKLELAAGLERNRAAAGDIGKPDQDLAFEDRLPAEEMAHALEECADAAMARVGNGPMVGDAKRKLLVLGADAEIGFPLAAGFQPRHEFAPRLDGSHVDLIAGHRYRFQVQGRGLRDRDDTQALRAPPTGVSR